MTEKTTKKQRKGSIAEEDVAALLQKYSPMTVLALLHEVWLCADVKRIDWNALVEKTSTGITSAREYQMLWRHLAYRDNLFQKLEDGAQPLDDDSDLEFELEPYPSVSAEASAEAAACVKVLMASGAPTNDSNPNGSTVEAPLTINIPKCQSSSDAEHSSSSQGTNIVIPVSVQKQPVPSVPVPEFIGVNGPTVGNLNKRKRKPWSEAEDMELIAAVQKCGEGNWANILRGDFKGDRTASQLSQRWAIIRKRHGTLNPASSSNGTQLSEAQLAARHAMSLALNFPVKNLTSNIISNGGTVTANKSAATISIHNPGSISNGIAARPNTISNSQPTPSTAETSTGGNNILQSPKQQDPASKPSSAGSLGPTTKPRVPPMKKPILKSTPNSSDAMVRATAVAAGARIASASDAASLLKAAQGKNAIHIMPSGSGSIKPSIPGAVSSLSETHPNVHYVRTGLVHNPIPSYTTATPSVPSPGPVRPIPPVLRHVPTANGTSSDAPSKPSSDVSSTPSRELPSKQVLVKITEETTVPDSGSSSKDKIRGSVTCVSENPSEEVKPDSKVTLSGPDAKGKGPLSAENPVNLLNLKTAENTQHIILDIEPTKAKESGKTNGTVGLHPEPSENKDNLEGTDENKNIGKVEEDVPSMVTGVEKNGQNLNIDKEANHQSMVKIVKAGGNSLHKTYTDIVSVVTSVEKNGEDQNINKEPVPPSTVTDGKVSGNQSLNKANADLPRLVTDAKEKDEDRNINKMEENLSTVVEDAEKNGENKT